MNQLMSDEQPDDGPSPIEFRPSLDAQVVPEGPRDLALVFLGASLVAGEADAIRDTSRSGRVSPYSSIASGRLSAMYGHAPWLRGSSWTHSTSAPG